MFSSDHVNYKAKSSSQPISLEIPPDLTQLARDTRYLLPGEDVSASGLALNNNPKDASIGPSKINDVRIERQGPDRWLVVGKSSQSLWPSIIAFWQDNGFSIAEQNEQTGFIETNWADNKTKLPDDFISRTLSSIMSNLISNGIKEKYITRIESLGPKETQITIVQRAMEEVATSNSLQSSTASTWHARDADPEQEVKFLRLLMVKLGASEALANNALADASKASASPSTKAVVNSNDQGISISYQEGFDTAWRRVGVALDRAGFTVEDRDRKLGIYYVRFVEKNTKSESNFLVRWFTNSPTPEGPQSFRLKIVEGSGKSSLIQILNASGEQDHSSAGNKIAKLLADDLR
jgi:outer membrane protein assembly factor BamC